jgi:carboxylate-amine ligase
MHPLMDPRQETVLWPHGETQIYKTFDRIFHCQGHGWSNLQSTHLNLPFCGDVEFGQLHAAVRLVLPILPALAASSPVVEGKLSDCLDARLQFYRSNAAAVPSVSGSLIPEPCFTRKAYETQILARIYRDMEVHDPAGVLQHEWVNARGAIARFDRDAIEIRLLDVQECPLADLSLIGLIVAVLRRMVGQTWLPTAAQQEFASADLVPLLRDCIRHGGAATVRDPAYLRAFGLPRDPCTVQQLWQHLHRTAWDSTALPAPQSRALHTLLEDGCLAERLRRALGERPKRPRLVVFFVVLGKCVM